MLQCNYIKRQGRGENLNDNVHFKFTLDNKGFIVVGVSISQQFRAKSGSLCKARKRYIRTDPWGGTMFSVYAWI